MPDTKQTDIEDVLNVLECILDISEPPVARETISRLQP
jgi:hypothetical protein